MIIRTVQDDIFKSKEKHIAFAVNAEGINDSGFAGQVSRQYWKELANCGEHKIGTVISKTIGDKTFHALVCHYLQGNWGENQAEIIRECFNNIPANGEPIASIAIGTGFVGRISGADFRQIVCGMHDSEQRIILHTGYTIETIIDCYNEEKENAKKEKSLLLGFK